MLSHNGTNEDNKLLCDWFIIYTDRSICIYEYLSAGNIF